MKTVFKNCTGIHTVAHKKKRDSKTSQVTREVTD